MHGTTECVASFHGTTAGVAKLLDVCKVLMTVCETVVEEDAAKGTVTTEENFSTFGGDLLKLLPEDARLPMMKIALMYQEEITFCPPQAKKILGLSRWGWAWGPTARDVHQHHANNTLKIKLIIGGQSHF